MSENIKLRFDHKSGQGSHNTAGQPDTANTAADDLGQAAEAESQMRKALGLLGETARHRPDAERTDAPARGAERFGSGLHRRRFVQDGDVPVTVLRREPGHEAPAHRSVATVATPSSSRVQRTEAALAAETAARERAERALAEVQAAVRDLQTKIGHADLAKHEAVETLLREREAGATLGSEVEALETRVQAAEARAEAAERAATEHQDVLAEERQVRRGVEKALRAAEVARDAAQELARSLSQQAADSARTEAPARRRTVDEPEVVAAAAKRGRSAVVAESEAEPEPVKWWLNPKPVSKRR